MNWLEKVAVQAFDDEMQRLLKEEGVDKIMDSRAVGGSPNANGIRNGVSYRSGTNVGIADEYNPTETESTYGQAV